MRGQFAGRVFRGVHEKPRIQEAFLEEVLTTAWAEQECSGWGRGRHSSLWGQNKRWGDRPQFSDEGPLDNSEWPLELRGPSFITVTVCPDQWF